MYPKGVITEIVEKMEDPSLSDASRRSRSHSGSRRKQGLVDSKSKVRAFWREQRDLVDCAKTVLMPVAWYIDIVALLAGVSYGGCVYGPLGALAGFFLTQSVVLFKIAEEVRRRMTIWLSESWETELVSARKVEEYKRELAKTKKL